MPLESVDLPVVAASALHSSLLASDAGPIAAGAVTAPSTAVVRPHGSHPPLLVLYAQSCCRLPYAYAWPPAPPTADVASPLSAPGSRGPHAPADLVASAGPSAGISGDLRRAVTPSPLEPVVVGHASYADQPSAPYGSPPAGAAAFRAGSPTMPPRREPSPLAACPASAPGCVRVERDVFVVVPAVLEDDKSGSCATSPTPAVPLVTRALGAHFAMMLPDDVKLRERAQEIDRAAAAAAASQALQSQQLSVHHLNLHHHHPGGRHLLAASAASAIGGNHSGAMSPLFPRVAQASSCTPLNGLSAGGFGPGAATGSGHQPQQQSVATGYLHALNASGCFANSSVLAGAQQQYHQQLHADPALGGSVCGPAPLQPRVMGRIGRAASATAGAASPFACQLPRQGVDTQPPPSALQPPLARAPGHARTGPGQVVARRPSVDDGEGGGNAAATNADCGSAHYGADSPVPHPSPPRAIGSAGGRMFVPLPSAAEDAEEASNSFPFGAGPGEASPQMVFKRQRAASSSTAGGGGSFASSSAATGASNGGAEFLTATITRERQRRFSSSAVSTECPSPANGGGASQQEPQQQLLAVVNAPCLVTGPVTTVDANYASAFAAPAATAALADASEDSTTGSSTDPSRVTSFSAFGFRRSTTSVLGAADGGNHGDGAAAPRAVSPGIRGTARRAVMSVRRGTAAAAAPPLCVDALAESFQCTQDSPPDAELPPPEALPPTVIPADAAHGATRALNSSPPPAFAPSVGTTASGLRVSTTRMTPTVASHAATGASAFPSHPQQPQSQWQHSSLNGVFAPGAAAALAAAGAGAVIPNGGRDGSPCSPLSFAPDREVTPSGRPDFHLVHYSDFLLYEARYVAQRNRWAATVARAAAAGGQSPPVAAVCDTAPPTPSMHQYFGNKASRPTSALPPHLIASHLAAARSRRESHHCAPMSPLPFAAAVSSAIAPPAAPEFQLPSVLLLEQLRFVHTEASAGVAQVDDEDSSMGPPIEKPTADPHTGWVFHRCYVYDRRTSPSSSPLEQRGDGRSSPVGRPTSAAPLRLVHTDPTSPYVIYGRDANSGVVRPVGLTDPGYTFHEAALADGAARAQRWYTVPAPATFATARSSNSPHTPYDVPRHSSGMNATPQAQRDRSASQRMRAAAGSGASGVPPGASSDAAFYSLLNGTSAGSTSAGRAPSGSPVTAGPPTFAAAANAVVNAAARCTPLHRGDGVVRSFPSSAAAPPLRLPRLPRAVTAASSTYADSVSAWMHCVRRDAAFTATAIPAALQSLARAAPSPSPDNQQPPFSHLNGSSSWNVQSAMQPTASAPTSLAALCHSAAAALRSATASPLSPITAREGAFPAASSCRPASPNSAPSTGAAAQWLSLGYAAAACIHPYRTNRVELVNLLDNLCTHLMGGRSMSQRDGAFRHAVCYLDAYMARTPTALSDNDEVQVLVVTCACLGCKQEDPMRCPDAPGYLERGALVLMSWYRTASRAVWQARLTAAERNVLHAVGWSVPLVSAAEAADTLLVLGDMEFPHATTNAAAAPRSLFLVRGSGDFAMTPPPPTRPASTSATPGAAFGADASSVPITPAAACGQSPMTPATRAKSSFLAAGNVMSPSDVADDAVPQGAEVPPIPVAEFAFASYSLRMDPAPDDLSVQGMSGLGLEARNVVAAFVAHHTRLLMSRLHHCLSDLVCRDIFLAELPLAVRGAAVRAYCSLLCVDYRGYAHALSRFAAGIWWNLGGGVDGTNGVRRALAAYDPTHLDPAAWPSNCESTARAACWFRAESTLFHGPCARRGGAELRALLQQQPNTAHGSDASPDASQCEPPSSADACLGNLPALAECAFFSGPVRPPQPAPLSFGTPGRASSPVVAQSALCHVRLPLAAAPAVDAAVDSVAAAVGVYLGNTGCAGPLPAPSFTRAASPGVDRRISVEQTAAGDGPTIIRSAVAAISQWHAAAWLACCRAEVAAPLAPERRRAVMERFGLACWAQRYTPSAAAPPHGAREQRATDGPSWIERITPVLCI